MATKKTYKPKVEGYVIAPVDGDNDGLVQDGTEFERPVGTEIDVLLEEVDESESWDETVPNSHVLADGENLQTVAALYLPEGMTRNEYAKKLYALNGAVSSGKAVRLG